jgi:hypothetical protein
MVCKLLMIAATGACAFTMIVGLADRPCPHGGAGSYEG